MNRQSLYNNREKGIAITRQRVVRYLPPYTADNVCNFCTVHGAPAPFLHVYSQSCWPENSRKQYPERKNENYKHK
jgi:hypothetical protein